MNQNSRVDIPLSRDASTRFLPWMVAFLTYVAALAFAGFLALHHLSLDWTDAIAGSVTVELLPLDGEEPEALAARVEATIEILRAEPGVESAEALSEADVLLLLEPWIGSALNAEALPLPRIFDVSVASGAQIDLAALNDRLLAATGAVADDHADWQRRLLGFLGAMEWAALAVVSVVTVAAVLMVAFATRGSLTTHRDTIELLHLIGAPDSYIARQFQFHAMRLALIGSAAGALLAAATVLVVGQNAGALLSDGDAWFHARLLPAAATLVLPPVAALVALVTARRMVLAALRRMV